MEIERLSREINWKRLHTYVKESLKEDKTGHDYGHIKRVLKIALQIASRCENIDYDVLVAACLLHDIANRDGIIKDHHLASAEETLAITPLLGFSEIKAKKIKAAIEDHVTYGKAVREDYLMQIESKILRDAHNLDNLGSFGLIKRIYMCQREHVPIFNSKEDKVNESIYGNVKFFLDVPEKMLTSEGKIIAEKRVKILKDFLKGLEGEDS
jgi:uncharacterized protein